MAYQFYFLELGKKLTLKSEFKQGKIAVFQSSSLDLTPPPGSGDNTAINISRGENILLHISIRRDVKKIIFNSKPAGGNWGHEEIIPLTGVFLTHYPIIRVYDHGDRYQILSGPKTIHYYKKRLPGNADNFSYGTQKTPSIFSKILAVTVHGSLPWIYPFSEAEEAEAAAAEEAPET